MTHLLHVFVLLPAVGLTLGCEPKSDRYAGLDAPPPSPQEVPLLDESERVDLMGDAKPEKSDPAECGRGTGRRGDGQCVELHTDDAGYVQRVMIPGGDFVIGSIPDHYDAEPTRTAPDIQWSGQPPRAASEAAFWIDLHEVTRQAYEACVAQGKCTAAVCQPGQDPVAELSDEGASLAPQTCVTHEQAAAFCAAQGARLPTEAQWEYAARGVDARIYPWGNEIRDEIPSTLLPAGRLRIDASYFGILGMGAGADEWVADAFEPEVALRSFVQREFRSATGPLRTATKGRDWGHVVKNGNTGRRRSVVGIEAKLGFRCAADLRQGGPEVLRVPDGPPPIPLVRTDGVVQVFGGVAEAVSRAEAAAFCDTLTVSTGPSGSEALQDWRLPTLAEVQAIAASFRGPGPFWTSDGATVQAREPDAPASSWTAFDAAATDTLAARCVRSTQ